MKQTILVIGGAGYIGSHACKSLDAAGFLPVTYDNLCYGHRSAVQWGPLEEGEMGDSKQLSAAFALYQPVAVLHFAAFTYVGESGSDPGKYYQNNVGATITLLEVMRRHHVDTIVFSSSCATYGLPQRLPLDEDHPQHPISVYGRTKWMVEQVLRDYRDAYHWKIALLRYFNASGADPAGRIGEAHDPETHLVPLVIETALKRRPILSIFGSDYPTPDGTAIRDYVHVDDLGSAHVKALQYLLKNRSSIEVNLGTGRGYSVQEVIDAVERITGHPVPTERQPRRPGDPPLLVADNRRAKTVLQWDPLYSSLENIIATAYRWHLRQTIPT